MTTAAVTSIEKLPGSVASAYSKHPPGVMDALLELRTLILRTAMKTPGIGAIEECLKWGQPSFVTRRPKSGSTIRIDALHDGTHRCAIYFICNTRLVDRFKEIYPDTFAFEGNRALVFNIGEALPEDELAHCLGMALTYHLHR